MIPWLLVLLLYGGSGIHSGVTIETLMFPDELSCEAARSRIIAAVRSHNLNRPGVSVCVPMLTEAQPS